MNVCDQTMATCMGPNGFSHLPHFLEYNCPLINGLPQIIPPPAFPLFSPSSFSLNQQNWSVTIQALTLRILAFINEINQGVKFGTLKKPRFSIFGARLPVSNTWNHFPRIIAFPQIIGLFWCEIIIIAHGYYLRKFCVQTWFFISCFRILNLSLPQSPHKERVETDKLQGMKKMFYDYLFS